MPNLGKEFEELYARETYTGLDGKQPKGWSAHEKAGEEVKGAPNIQGRQRSSSSQGFGVGVR